NVPRSPVASGHAAGLSGIHPLISISTRAPTMAVTKISVPKTPKSAFNKNRQASGLLLAQLEHLETAAGDYQPPKKKGKKPLTEGQVAARIHELTRTLHPHAAHVQLPTERMISHA